MLNLGQLNTIRDYINNGQFEALDDYLEGIYAKRSGQLDALVRRCAELEEELKVTEKLLAERQRVLDAIPECKAHGKNCVPNALEWIAKQLHEASA